MHIAQPKMNKIINTVAIIRPSSRFLYGILISIIILTTMAYHAIAATSLKPVTANSRFAWLLQGTPSSSVFGSETGPKVYDFDPDNTDAGGIAALKSQGITTICYFSAGTAEDWRDDYSSFTSSDKLEALPGWDGEYVVDTESANVRDIMATRIQNMSDMGCDGIEPDNIDAYTNISSSLNETTTLDYMKFLADTAHSYNLSIALKNSSDLVTAQLPGGSTVVNTYDFAIVEECYAYSECDSYTPFIAQNKAVFIIEYGSSPDCTDADSKNFDAYEMSLDLDGSIRQPCRTSGGVTPPADTTNPTVSITAPASAATVNGSAVSIAATASDNVGVSKVEFRYGTTLLGEDTTAPYSYSWDSTTVANGSYNLTARAYDTAGNTATSSAVTVTVNNTMIYAPEITSVSLSQPTNGATLSGNATLAISGSDHPNLVKVEYYQGATLLSTKSTSPFSYTWDTTTVANGSYNLTARAYDTAGNTATSSAVTVTVNNTNPPAPIKFVDLSKTTSLNPDAVAKAVIETVGNTCQSITSATSISATGLTAPKDTTIDGGIQFSLSCASSGQSATMKITLGQRYEDITKLRAYKLETAGGLIDISSQVTFTNATSATVVTYDIVDGGQLDEDGLANGVIDDPIYVGYVAGASTTTPTVPATNALSNTGANIVNYILLALAAISLPGSLLIWKKQS